MVIFDVQRKVLGEIYLGEIRMPVQEKSGFCEACNKQVMVRRKGTNHLLHLILSILTGVWIIVWILASIFTDDWRCSQCGSTKISQAE